jgi:hypothetical protein
MKAPKDRIKQEARLQALFQQHFAKVHMREDASQVAARVVREAELTGNGNSGVAGTNGSGTDLNPTPKSSKSHLNR